MDFRFPEPGDELGGRYQIFREIGRGGFSRIYRARESVLGRDVAVKVFDPDPMTDAETTPSASYGTELQRRFSREARNVSRLRDPHTVTLYYYGRTDRGLLYLVFEYLEGRTLATVRDESEPLEPARVVDILSGVASSLEEAHFRGMLHRDIKPGNIMLHDYAGRTNRVKVLDFGISKIVFSDHQRSLQNLTDEGLTVGTPRYMAPEQLRADRVTPATDVYSLGLVAYELLTHRKVMAGLPTWQIIESQIDDSPILLPEQLEIPDNLRAIVHRMVAKDPERRFPSAGKLVDALERWDDTRFDWASEWLDSSDEDLGETTMNVDPAQILADSTPDRTGGDTERESNVISIEPEDDDSAILMVERLDEPTEPETTPPSPSPELLVSMDEAVSYDTESVQTDDFELELQSDVLVDEPEASVRSSGDEPPPASDPAADETEPSTGWLWIVAAVVVGASIGGGIAFWLLVP